MENDKVLLIGGGGHCSSVLDCLIRCNQYKSIGIVGQNISPALFPVPIVGNDTDLPQLFHKGWTNAVIAVGSIGNPIHRRAIYSQLKKIGFVLPVVIDPSALIGYDAEIGEGTFVGKQAVINSRTRIGCCAVINTGACVEHDCVIGDFVHISPGCTLCGSVQVGENTHVGAGSVVRQQLEIGCDALIGAGSVVVSHIPDSALAFGNPCRISRK